MILAALRELLPRSAWAALLVQPETVLGWHRDLIRRRRQRTEVAPRTGRPPLAEAVRELIVRIARENPRWGYFRIRGELLNLGYTVRRPRFAPCFAVATYRRPAADHRCAGASS